MNAFHNAPHAIRATPCLASNGLPIPNLFDLHLQYKPGGRWELYSETYVSEYLLPRLMDSGPRCFAMQVVGSKGVARRFLPAATRYLVLGCGTKDGVTTNGIPMRLQRVRLTGLLMGGCLGALGVGLYLQGGIWMGTVALLAGSHLWRTVWPIPSTRFLDFKWFHK